MTVKVSVMDFVINGLADLTVATQIETKPTLVANGGIGNRQGYSPHLVSIHSTAGLSILNPF